MLKSQKWLIGMTYWKLRETFVMLNPYPIILWKSGGTIINKWIDVNVSLNGYCEESYCYILFMKVIWIHES